MYSYNFFVEEEDMDFSNESSESDDDESYDADEDGSEPPGEVINMESDTDEGYEDLDRYEESFINDATVNVGPVEEDSVDSQVTLDAENMFYLSAAEGSDSSAFQRQNDPELRELLERRNAEDNDYLMRSSSNEMQGAAVEHSQQINQSYVDSQGQFDAEFLTFSLSLNFRTMPNLFGTIRSWNVSDIAAMSSFFPS